MTGLRFDPENCLPQRRIGNQRHLGPIQAKPGQGRANRQHAMLVEQRAVAAVLLLAAAEALKLSARRQVG